MKGILVCKLIQDIKLLRMTFSIWRIYYAQYLYGTRLVLYYFQLLRSKMMPISATTTNRQVQQTYFQNLISSFETVRICVIECKLDGFRTESFLKKGCLCKEIALQTCFQN